MRRTAQGVLLLCVLGMLGCSESHPSSQLAAEPGAPGGGAHAERPRAAQPPQAAPRAEVPPSAAEPGAIGSAGAPAATPAAPSVPPAPEPTAPAAPAAGHSAVPPPPGEDFPWPKPEGPQAEQLFGHWRGEGALGDCINFQSWYSFDAQGRVVNRSIDDNDCSGPRLAAEASGHYTIVDSFLEIVLDGIGSDRPLEMAATTATVGERREALTVAIAERPADQFRAAATLLDGRAFISLDGAIYQSERYLHLVSDVGGEPLFDQEVLVTLEVDPPLPLAEGASCHVLLGFWLSQFDAGVSAQTTVDEMTIEFDATVRADLDRKQLIANELAAVAPEAQADAWQAMLAARGLDTHSQAFAATYRQHVFPSLRFTDDEPHVLSVSLPQYGRWTKSETPPPLP